MTARRVADGRVEKTALGARHLEKEGLSRPLFDRGDFRIPAGVAHLCAGGETAFLWAHDAALRGMRRTSPPGCRGGRRWRPRWSGRATRLAARWGVTRAISGLSPPSPMGFPWWRRAWSCARATTWWWTRWSIRPSWRRSRGSGLRRRRTRAWRSAWRAGRSRTGCSGLVDGRTRVIGASCVSFMTGERLDPGGAAGGGGCGGRAAGGGLHAGGGVDADRCRRGRFRLCVLLQVAAGDDGDRGGVLEPVAATEMGADDSGVAFHRRGGAAGMDRGAGGEAGCDAVHARQPGARAVIRAEQRAGLPGPVRPGSGGGACDRAGGGVDRAAGRCRDTVDHAGGPGAARGDVCMDSSAAQAMVEELYTRGIYAWNGHGRLRFSLHGYNALDDVARAAAAMREIWRA